ncbi:MAG: hypothetical protein GX443_18375 [Deltaproteobacteria bacterium]|nr:hypothetical protein [Deltaproteobacteria bacterium]
MRPVADSHADADGAWRASVRTSFALLCREPGCHVTQTFLSGRTPPTYNSAFTKPQHEGYTDVVDVRGKAAAIEKGGILNPDHESLDESL